VRSNIERRLRSLEARISAKANTWVRVIVDGESEEEAVRRIFPEGVPDKVSLIVHQIVDSRAGAAA